MLVPQALSSSLSENRPSLVKLGCPLASDFSVGPSIVNHHCSTAAIDPLSSISSRSSFVTLFVALSASTEAVSALVQLIGSHPGFVGTGLHPVGDEVAREAVIGGTVRAGRTKLPCGRLVRERPYYRRCRRRHGLFDLPVVGPGTFGSTGGRIGPGRHAIDVAYLATASLVILCSHLRVARARRWLGFFPGHHGAP